MSIKLYIKAFQSIEEAELEIDGFTVVTGPNNEGKSALVRAIKGAFSNYTGYQHGWVKHGHDALSVRMVFGEGSHFLWERGPDYSRYEINDKILDKAGQFVPEELDVFKVHPITVGRNNKIWPQIADQFNQTFLVYEPGSVLAEAIADTERVGKLNSALRKAESDRKSCAAKARIRFEDLDSVKEELSYYEGFSLVQKTYLELENQRDFLKNQIFFLEKLSKIQDKLKREKKIYLSLKEVDGFSTFKFDRIQTIKDRILLKEKLYHLSIRLKSSNKDLKKLSSLNNISVPKNPSFMKYLEKLKDLHRILLGLQNKIQSLNTLDKIPFFENKTDLEKKISFNSKRIRLCEKLKSIFEKISTLKKSISNFDVKITDLEKEKKFLSEEKEKIIKELEICPLCGSEV